MGRSAKLEGRDALLRQLGAEALALFQGGALPVPAKLRETVAALGATPKGEGPMPSKDGRRRKK